jgi:hypothetical protein
MDTYDLEIYKGVTLNFGLTLNSSNGTPIDLTNYDITGTIKSQYSDLSGIANLSITKLYPFSGGQISINLSSDETKLLPITTAFYDIKINQNNITTLVLNGKIFIFPTTT